MGGLANELERECWKSEIRYDNLLTDSTPGATLQMRNAVCPSWTDVL